MVYGSDPVRAKWLRTGVDGKMKMSSGGWLPYNTMNGEKTGGIDPILPTWRMTVCIRCHIEAGDIRASEHPGIAGLHTLFVT